MSFSYRHMGNNLPVTLHLDETEVTRPCPLCQRAEFDGTITFVAGAERTSGATTARCGRGHLVMVNWTREETPAQ